MLNISKLKMNSTAQKRKIEVCLTPALLHLYPLQGKVVVLIDIFRASSAICTAIAHGVQNIIPIESIEEAESLRDKGYIVAAERKGEVVEGFPFGNSPYAFMNPDLKGKTIGLTTTNCTRAIHLAQEAEQIVIGSFLNISSLVNYLQDIDHDIVLLCAGWNNKINLEDTLFAGSLIQELADSFEVDCDAGIAALQLYECSQYDIAGFLARSTHRTRLSHLNLDADIEYCLRRDIQTAIPVFNGYSISNLLQIEIEA